MPTIHLLSNAPAGKETVQERPNKQGRRDRVIHDVTDPTLTVFLPPQRDPSGIAVVVCPGGGYSGIVIDKEGFQVAQKLN